MTDVNIIISGMLNNTINKKYLKHFKSNIFRIKKIEDITLKPDKNYDFPNCKFEKFKEFNNINELTIFICDFTFPGGLVSMPIDNNLIVLSTYDFEKYLKKDSLKFEKFLLRFVLSFSIIYKTNNNVLPPIDNPPNLIHKNTEGCLFDYSCRITDLLIFHSNPILCLESKSDLKSKQKPENYIKNIEIDINKLGRSSFEKIELFASQKPFIMEIIFLLLGCILGFILSKI
ncbi:MAG: hypothetical protein HXX09_15735 [Bacteroidetes bacterium]|nr:hypothetical protein [Bacteroidota bacterium]